MKIQILVNPPEEVITSSAVRLDTAWKLFMPDHIGDLPNEWKRENELFKQWLWTRLSMDLGFLKVDREKIVDIIAPQMTEEGKEFIVRICSFWADDVRMMSIGTGSSGEYEQGENLWLPPVVNIMDSSGPTPAIRKMAEKYGGGTFIPLSPVLGYDRTYITTYVIHPGRTYSRFHSHATIDEIYMVLSGSGSIRIGGHTTKIATGDLVSKPTGPDLPTQFLADNAEKLHILDIEITPEAEKNSKEIVSYPDHHELYLAGEGWGILMPSDCAMDTEDGSKNYEKGYRRHPDGSWEPADIPGFETRES